jgi:hypothetical protein
MALVTWPAKTIGIRGCRNRSELDHLLLSACFLSHLFGQIFYALLHLLLKLPQFQFTLTEIFQISVETGTALGVCRGRCHRA